MFGAIRDDFIDKFVDAYQKVEDDIADAQEGTVSSTEGFRPSPSSSTLAGRGQEVRPDPRDHPDARTVARPSITAGSRWPQGRLGADRPDSKKFASVAFDPKDLAL